MSGSPHLQGMLKGCERTPPAMRTKAMILVALLLAAFLVNLDTTIVNVALPALVRELHATTTELQWVVDSFNLVFAALLLTFGSLSDRFGRKGMLLAGLAVFGTASLAGGFTTDPAQLIAARSVMGLGAAMTFPATLSLISNVFTERGERARAIGLWGASAGVAIAMGPYRGGLAAGALQLGQHLHRHGAGSGGRRDPGGAHRSRVEGPGGGSS
jgi:MFS family permease